MLKVNLYVNIVCCALMTATTIFNIALGLNDLALFCGIMAVYTGCCAKFIHWFTENSE
jgi:hypothetical protein